MPRKSWSLTDLPEKMRQQAAEQLESQGGIPEALKARKSEVAEGDFQESVIQYATLRGWRHFHTFDSRRSAPGFPDLVLLRGDRQVIAELKTEVGSTTPEQDDWLRAFVDVGAEVFTWRPGDWDEIESTLR